MNVCDFKLIPSDIFLPAPGSDFSKWAVVACDQFTSQHDYWERADALVGDAPSALRLILPEAYLSQTEARVPQINARMRDYLDRGVLRPAVHGFVLTERQISTGVRKGLVAAIDLEAYDFSPGSTSPVRCTEGTILSRIPPRVAIRKDAPLELPHILMLADDPEKTLIEPLYERRHTLRRLYDFDLMAGGGHIAGYAVESGEDLRAVESAVAALMSRESQRARYLGDGEIALAVGDGNHSLATAKTIWEEKKQTLTPAQRENDPERFALVEINNLHDESMVFEPIHRVLFGADEAVLARIAALADEQRGSGAPQSVACVAGEREAQLIFAQPAHSLPVGSLQLVLDALVRAQPSLEIDYIHGEEAVRALCDKPGTIGFLLESIDKRAFFRSILKNGPMPRKTFSIGEAQDKRYYLEARRIK